MDKIKFQQLDIPIIRSCNLGCRGCLTFSDSKKIKGIVKLEESKEWLKYWSTKLLPVNTNIFGGEPLLHPEFIEWCLYVGRMWPISNLRVYTNGYYIPSIIADEKTSKIFELSGKKISFVVSIQTAHEPYYSTVLDNIEKLKQYIVTLMKKRYRYVKAEWIPLEKSEEGSVYYNWRLYIDQKLKYIEISMCEQFKMPWQAHYTGYENTLKPHYEYDDGWYDENHKNCQAKTYVNLYKGKLYKCPTSAVLAHTLNTFNLQDNKEWEPYITNYESLDVTADDDHIIQWFETQNRPEKICNMCGFSGPRNSKSEGQMGHLDRHELKENWIMPISSL